MVNDQNKKTRVWIQGYPGGHGYQPIPADVLNNVEADVLNNVKKESIEYSYIEEEPKNPPNQGTSAFK